MKHEHMVGMRLPKALVRELERIEAAERADRSTTLRKLLTKAIEDWKLEHYAQQYGNGKLSLARAAREAGVSLWEFQDYVRAHKVPVQYDGADLEHDLNTIHAQS
jgi:predicted HTH domain antitoxin